MRDRNGFGNDGYCKLLLPGNACVDHSYAGLPGGHPYARAAGWFDGASWLTTPDSGDWAFGSGDFCIKFWFRPTVATSYVDYILQQGTESGNGDPQWCINISPNGVISFYEYSSIGVSSITAAALNTWTHVVFARCSGTMRIYLNGLKDKETSYTATIPDRAQTLWIGKGRDPSAGVGYMKGYLSDLHISSGTGSCTGYTGETCVVPTAPLVADAYTKLLLPMLTPGTTFTDASPSPKTITRNGNACITARPITNNGGVTVVDAPGGHPYARSAGYFPGSSSVSAATNADFNLSSGAFTLRFWAYVTSLAASVPFFGRNRATTPWDGYYYQSNTSGQVTLVTNNNTSVITSATGVCKLNTWQFHEIVSDGTNVSVYVDEVQAGSSWAGTLQEYGDTFYAGYSPANGYMPGFMVDFELAKGINRTAIVPTAPLVADSYTKLLLPMNMGVDQVAKECTANLPITYYGTVSLKQMANNIGPCNPLAIDVMTASGCMSLAYKSDWDMGTGQFTMEGWFYATGTVGVVMFGAGDWTGGNMLFGNGTDGRLCFQGNGSNIIINTSLTTPLNQWFHVALTRNASNLVTIWINGVPVGTATSAADFPCGKRTFNIAGYTTVNRCTCLVGWVHYTKGTCLYNSTFTPPTCPVTCADTKLLIVPGSKSTVFMDQSNLASFKAITRNGNAVQSMLPPGKKALSFTGSEYLTSPINTEFDIIAGVNDFTVDFWYKTTDALATNPRVICYGDYASNGWWVYLQSNAFGLAVNGNGVLTCNWTPPSSSVWAHIAFVRYCGVLYGYCNGIMTNSTPYTGAAGIGNYGLYVGRNSTTTLYYLKGGMANVRVTKGLARWTRNFIPPQRCY